MPSVADMLTDLKKRFGDDALRPASERDSVAVIPTGCLSLDVALGVGGLPRGRVIEIFGPESGGKTSLCQSITTMVQQMGGVAAYVDVEHALDLGWLKKWGVNLDKLYLTQPNGAEIALELVKAIAGSGAVDIIFVDSVASLVPKKIREDKVGDANVALIARLMSDHLPDIINIAAENNCTVVFVNQIRMKIGVMFGDPETTKGGMALRFGASVRIKMWGGNPIDLGNNKGGVLTKFKVLKNKVGPPFLTAESRLLFDGGFDTGFEVFNFATTLGIITGKGVGRNYKGEYFTPSNTVKKSSWGGVKVKYKDNPESGKQGAILDISPGGKFYPDIENEVRERLRLPLVTGTNNTGKGDNIPKN